MKNKELGIVEEHPFGEFIPPGASKMIIGSFPIGKFTNPNRRSEIDHDKEFLFFYGGVKNKLWKLIGECNGVELKSKEEIVTLLTHKHIGVADIIKSCRRVDRSALDRDLKEINWSHDLINLLKQNSIKELIFTSKWVKEKFEKYIGELGSFVVTTLISPSPTAMISLSISKPFKDWKVDNPDKRPMDYRLMKYKEIFK